MEHYLTLRKLEIDFKPLEAHETTMPFAVEYYQQSVLYTIGKLVGKPLKVDLNTAATVRDKFAKAKSTIFVMRISNFLFFIFLLTKKLRSLILLGLGLLM